MIDKVPESHQYLLEDKTKAFAWVATVDLNGLPQVTAVWFNTDGKHLLFNTMDGTAKFRYLKANPQVAVAIPDPQNPHKYIQIRGTVELSEEGAVEHTHSLSRKYTGNDFQLRPGSKRIKFSVTPQRITIWPPAQ